MDKLVIDFETYYDTEYSLSKMTTAEYIKNAQFQVIGVSVLDKTGTTHWYSGTRIQIKAFLKQFDWEHSMCVAHNAIFDGAILEWVFDIHPAEYFCTMMASRPWITPYTDRMSLDTCSKYLNFGYKGTVVQNFRGMRRNDFNSQQLASYGDYCNNDVDLTVKIAIWLLALYPDDEKLCVDLTIKKYTRPKLLINKNICEARLDEVLVEKDVAINSSGVDKGTLMSNAKFAKELEARGAEVPMKTSPTTGKRTFAFAKTDHEFTKLLHSNTPSIARLVDARLKVKSTIEETRLQRFINLCSATGTGELAVPLLYYGARPGRYSGLDKLNLQNLSRGSELRRAIEAPLGYKLLASDLSQIEARITACLAGQDDLVQQFANGEDVYANFATTLFNRIITEEDDPDERFIGKQGILQLGYQAWVDKFFDSMRQYGHPIPYDMAYKVVTTYRRKFSKIPDLWETMEEMITAMITGTKMQVGPVYTAKNTLWLPNGMPIIYPELKRGADGKATYMVGKQVKSLYGGKMTENVVQALARIVMSTAEIRLAKRGLRAALSVHDELVYVVRDEYLDAVKRATTLALTAPVTWMPKLPVACTTGIGDTYYDCK